MDKLPVFELQKKILVENEKFDIENFSIIPFEVYHDVKNFGYLLKHNPSGMKILYIIDTSSISNLTFKDIDVFIIEANHSYEWLENKDVLDFKDYRTYGEQGHLAVEDTIEFLNNNINHNTKKIILTHISSSCEDYKEIEKKVINAINNDSIEIIAIDPNKSLNLVQEIVLKEDLKGYDFI